MSITITVEDGSVVTAANSFVSLADFKAHADQRGRVYTVVYNDEVIKAALIKMGDYLNSPPWGATINKSADIKLKIKEAVIPAA